MRSLRYAATEGCGLRATGHTATDQVETVLYRIVSSGSTRGIKMRREDGVVRPLLEVSRDETTAYCEEHGLPVRTDVTNAETARGLIRHQILPLLRPPPPRRRGEPARPRGGASLAPASPRSLTRRAPLLAGGLPVGRSRKGRSCRPRVRHPATRGHGRVGAVDARKRSGRSRGATEAAGGSSGRAPQESAGSPRGRESAEGGARDMACRRVWRGRRRRSRHRGGTGLGGRRRREEESLSDVEPWRRRDPDRRDVGQGARRRPRGRDLGRLRRARPAPRRRAQGRGLLHGRPDARALDPLRDRLHGDLELRSGDRLLGGRPDPQGPRHQHRRPRRARRRGHHRLRARRCRT